MAAQTSLSASIQHTARSDMQGGALAVCRFFRGINIVQG